MNCTTCNSKRKNTSGESSAGQDNSWKDINEAIIRVQQALVNCGYACYRSALMASNANINPDLVDFTFKDAIEQWTNVVQFIQHRIQSTDDQGNDETDERQLLMDQLVIRQLVIKGLINLTQPKSGRPVYLDVPTVNRFILDTIKGNINKNLNFHTFNSLVYF